MNVNHVAKGGRGPILGTIPGSWSPVPDSQVRIPWIHTGSDAHPTGRHNRQNWMFNALALATDGGSVSRPGQFISRIH